MTEMHAEPVRLREVTIEAVVMRADGTREDLGVIARMAPDEPPKKTWRTLWREKTRGTD